MKSRYFAICLIGANSICCQVILIREIIAVFSGNELTMGFVLASWFLWVAAGSTIGGRWKGKNDKSIFKRFAFFQAVLPFILLIQIILIRQSRLIFGLPQMAIVGLGPVFWVSFLLLAPLCLILGLMFSLGYQWLCLPEISPASRVGWVYVLEAIGAGVGGGLFSFLLIRIMSHLQIGILLGVVNLMACFLIIFQESGWTPAALSASGVLILFFAILFLYSLISPLDLYVYSLQWKDFELIDCRDSIYGRIALTRMNGEYSFYEHGVLTGTVPDLWTSEWSIHLPLIQHPDPKTLLLIGTGIGSLKEALKYKGVYKIDYIELDPTALSLAEKYCPPIYIEPLKDPKVHPVYKDARLHMRAKAGQEYDVIILGLPDPKTAQLNRMYTAEFFRLASDRLSENGIMAFSVTSSENYIGPQLADFLRCIYKTVRSVFPEVLIAPGDMAHFIAGGKSPFMTLDPNVITQRLYARGIETEFFSEFYIPSNLSKERISSLGDIVRNTQKVWINEDLKPICYLYDLILWGRYFSPITGNILEKAKEMDRGRLLFLCLILVLLVMSTRFLGKEKSRRQVIGLIVLLGGFIEIILEFLLVLSFQVFYGYAYLQLGILITGFMVGLTIGSAIMTHILDRLANTYKCFIGIQASYFLYPLFVIFLFKRSDLGLWPAISVEFLFLVLSLIAGFIGGLQFPIATRLFIANTEKWKGQAGLLYGLDLVGSALGAILASSYLVPLFGIPATLGVLSLTGGLCLCLLIVNL